MSAIKPGDLVMVVKPTPCCGATEWIGRSFTVLSGSFFQHVCSGCGRESYDTENFAVVSGRTAVRRDRLIKIDPPADMKDTETEKELTV